LAERIGVRSQLAAREDLKIETAVGLLFDRRCHLASANVHRVRFGKIVGVFVDPLCLLGASNALRSD
jgi:hypothetical protein